MKENWDACAKAARFQRVPDKNNNLSRNALKKAERWVGDWRELDADTSPVRDNDLEELERLVTLQDPDWDELAVLAKRLLVKVGAGILPETSAYQVTALKEIIARAEGRVGQKKEKVKEELAGLVILPVLTLPDESMVTVVELEEIDD